MRWYAVRTRPNQEQKAAMHLRNQAFEVFVPLFRKTVSHARKRIDARRPLFPSYLFIQLDDETSPWRSINGTVGVDGVVSAGNRPMPVGEGVVEELLIQSDSDGVVHLRPQLGPEGSMVRVIGGAFIDQLGRLVDMDGEERVILLMSFLDREVRVNVNISQVSCVI